MLPLARRLLEAPLCAAHSLVGGVWSRVGAGSTPPRSGPTPHAPASASGRGRLAAASSSSSSASAARPSPTPWHFGPKISWDSARDGDAINAETMCSAFARAGFPRTKALNFAAGHALKDHAHSKKGYKRVGVASSSSSSSEKGAGGKFIIRPKAWTGPAAAEAEAGTPAASLSDVELSVGDSVDIPPGLVHAAWVVGDEGIVFVMGDEED